MRRRDFFAVAGGAFAATKALACECACEEQAAAPTQTGQPAAQSAPRAGAPAVPTPWQAGQHDRVLSKVTLNREYLRRAVSQMLCLRPAIDLCEHLIAGGSG